VTRSQDNPDMTAFAAAMTHYSAGRYADAARGLRAIVEHAPEMAQAQFFLGVSELMTGHPREAHAALDQTVASGVSPYSDEAHFYLAKADLREKNVTAARKELMLAVDLEAGPGGEAARLLEALNQFER
jgi:TolA-binding protein